MKQFLNSMTFAFSEFSMIFLTITFERIVYHGSKSKTFAKLSKLNLLETVSKKILQNFKKIKKKFENILKMQAALKLATGSGVQKVMPSQHIVVSNAGSYVNTNSHIDMVSLWSLIKKKFVIPALSD